MQLGTKVAFCTQSCCDTPNDTITSPMWYAECLLPVTLQSFPKFGGAESGSLPVIVGGEAYWAPERCASISSIQQRPPVPSAPLHIVSVVLEDDAGGAAGLELGETSAQLLTPAL
jgi:hypothetical protein